MASWSRRVRRVIAVTLALAAGVALAAFWVRVVDDPERAEHAEPPSATVAHAARFDHAPRPPRARARPESDVAASEESRGGSPDREPPALPSDAAPVPTDAPDAIDAAAAEFFLSRRPATVLLAAPDRDVATGNVPTVEVGRPPEIALAAYVARGAAAVDRSAELVGERKPVVEEGVPVAVSGRVVEAEGGLPILGARIVISSTFYVRRYFYDHHLREVACADTDADGRWSIQRLNVDPAHFGEDGRLYVTVTAESHAPALTVPIATVSHGVANRLPDVALRRAAETLRGRVLDYWEGRPVVGARVYATGAISPIAYPKDERAALFVGAPTAVTDADGRFVLEGLGAGLQTISVHGTDDCIGSAGTSLPHAAELVVRTRQLRGRIAGTTVDEHGDPVALVTVTCADNSTHSFADGGFALENFRGDAVTVQFAHPDYAPVVLQQVRDGTAGLVVRMEKRHIEVALDVRDRDTGAAVPRVQLSFTFAEGTSPPPRTSPERLAPDGVHRVRLPAGAMSVVITAAGHRAERTSLTGLADGDRVQVVLGSASGE